MFSFENMRPDLIIRLLLFYFLVLAGTIRPQQLIFFKPENLKQLPSSETYNVMQDHEGFIWFSTEGGLCRYNGDNLKVFDGRAGLPEAATYAVKLHGDEIWVSTSKCRILKYVNGRFEELPFTKSVAKIFNDLKYVISQISFINDSTLMASSQRNSNYFINLRTGKITQQEINTAAGDFHFTIYDNAEFTVQVPYLPDSINQDLRRKYLTIDIKNNDRSALYRMPYEKAYFPSWRCFVVKDKKQHTWLGIDAILIDIGPDGKAKMHKMQNTILSLYKDAEDGLWVGLLNNGLHYFPNGVISDEVAGLPDLSVSGICKDNEGGIWCTTLEKGIFYCRNRSILDHSNIEDYKKPILLKYIEGRLFTSHRPNMLVEMYHKQIMRHFIEVANLPFADITSYNDGWLLCSLNFLGTVDRNYGHVKQLWLYPNVTGASKQLTTQKNDDVYGLTYGAVYRIAPPKMTMIMTPSPARCLLRTDDGTLYTGGSDGVRVLRDTSWVNIPGVNATIIKMMQAKSGTIWIATKDGGVYLLNNNKILNFDKILPLKTKRFSDITEDIYGNIWLASNIGLVKIAPREDGYRVAYYNTLSGLPSNEIFRVAAGDSALYFTTPEGMGSFPLPEHLTNQTAPVVILEDLYVNDEKMKYSTAGLTLPYSKNTIKVRMNVFTFKRAGVAPTLIYIVKGAGVNYQSVRSNELALSNLSPGQYSVIIYALNNDMRLSTHPLSLSFEIQKPWWQSLFFIIPIVLIFLIAVVVIVRIIIRRIRTKETEKTRINKLLAEYHMSALRAQMNPHFIFNCINSIQRFILTKKSQEAYNYLTKFSRLIRLVLNYAEKNMITLSQELEIVELYTELEQLRFDNKFTYQFRISGNVRPDEMYVPVLIIQPYIENAIWHGIMNLEDGKTGHISITILYEDNVLQIIVEDNGVGREKAAAFSKKNHESKATWINNKRAEIINMAGNNVQTVRIDDVLAMDGTVAGTRVSIYISQTNQKPHEQDQLHYR